MTVPHDEIDPARASRRQPRASRINTNDLMAKVFEPIRWIVPGYVPEGFSVLAGRQKLGKTWMAIDIAIAVATGGFALGGIQVEQGDVLYLDLENGPRRIKRRIEAIYPSPNSVPDLSRLEWMSEAPALDKDLIEILEEWRRSAIHPRLIIIDVLQRVKPVGNAARNSYENDYSAYARLQQWAMQKGIAVVGLHHTRKGGADDPLEALSGSNGLSACADTTLVLNRDGNGITLYVRGRDVEVKESAMTFVGGLWSIAGDAAKVRITTERQAILDALLDAEEPLSPKDLSAATGMRDNNLRQLLLKMTNAGEVRKVKRGWYQHPDHAPSDNNGNGVTNEE